MSDSDESTPSAALVKPKRRPRATPEVKAFREKVRDSRVEYVADLMRSLKFRTGVTTKALAVEWDLPNNLISSIVVEASRRVRAELANPDNVQSKISVALNHVIDQALESGDRHAIIKACQVWAQVTGAAAPQRLQVQQDLTSLTPEQLKARKEELIARLTRGPDIIVESR